MYRRFTKFHARDQRKSKTVVLEWYSVPLGDALLEFPLHYFSQHNVQMLLGIITFSLCKMQRGSPFSMHILSRAVSSGHILIHDNDPRAVLGYVPCTAQMKHCYLPL